MSSVAPNNAKNYLHKQKAIYELRNYENYTFHIFFNILKIETHKIGFSMKNHPICFYFQLSTALGDGYKVSAGFWTLLIAKNDLPKKQRFTNYEITTLRLYICFQNF